MLLALLDAGGAAGADGQPLLVHIYGAVTAVLLGITGTFLSKSLGKVDALEKRMTALELAKATLEGDLKVERVRVNGFEQRLERSADETQKLVVNRSDDQDRYIMATLKEIKELRKDLNDLDYRKASRDDVPAMRPPTDSRRETPSSDPPPMRPRMPTLRRGGE